MQGFTCIRACVGALLLAALGLGQTATPPDNQAAQAQQTTPAQEEKKGWNWQLGGLNISGLVDTYASLNFNHPDSRYNNLRNFDTRADSVALNMAKLSFDYAPAPVGFKVEFAGGRAMTIFHSTEPGQHDLYHHLFQAYVSLKPAAFKGVQIDVGKFVTSAGSEVTETHLNWNYSRSLLYANGPYYHFGLRSSVPITKSFSAGFQLVNGWNNIEENNGGKTMGFTTALTTSKVNWFNNYYVGPEKFRMTEGWRHFYDTVVALNPSGKVNGLINFDYGQENIPGEDAYKFYGVSLAMRTLLGSRFALSPRYDWYKDRDGFITGNSQTLQEFTMSFDYKIRDGFLSRFEYRRDWSDQPYFDRGFERGVHKSMNTLLASFIVYFGPKQ